MNTTPHKTWSEAFRVYLHPRVLAMLFLGFSAGLPLLMVFTTLTAWLSDEGLSKTTIGFFSWIGITYSIKVLWAPVVDHFQLPLFGRLGQRRGWMLLAQLGIALGLVAMSQIDPSTSLQAVAIAALFVAFSSATQDVAIDAYRIEAVVNEVQGAMSATYILGYRSAMLMAGAGSLYIAQYQSWSISYLSMGLMIVVGMVTTLCIAEPLQRQAREFAGMGEWLHHSIVEPFTDFMQRYASQALIILCLVGLYRVSDITMGIMANPFYLDLGFSKAEIASISKVFGFAMTIVGAGFGGVLVVRYGIYWPLLAGAILVMLTNFLFVLLNSVGANISVLALVISADNLSGGLAVASFVAYLSSLTSREYTATQYALFSSLMTLPGKFIGGFAGIVADGYGYGSFFLYAALLGIPAILLVMYLKSSIEAPSQTASSG